MPLDDILSEVAGGFFRFLLELFWEVICYQFGYWTLRIITFGRFRPSEDSWVCAVVGLIEIIAIIWGVTEWIW